eukprot:jgi/Psemu1/295638/fgenesh1_pm.78_\
MTLSSVRTALQHNGRSCFHYTYSGLRSTIPRRVTGSLRRSLSTSSAPASQITDNTNNDNNQSPPPPPPPSNERQERLIPTRHSSRAPPPVCRDATELRELTQELLETPIGSLYCQRRKAASNSASPRDDRDEAYALARESGELVEYVLRGYNGTISPLSQYGGAAAAAAGTDPEEASASLETMMDVMDRFHQEGEMYLQLRKEALGYRNGSDLSDSSSSSSSSSSTDSDSDSDSDNTDDPRFSSAVADKLRVDALDRDRAKQKQKQLGSGTDDFALPGVTTAMYDAILDAMACASQVALESEAAAPSSSFLQRLEPDDLYRVAGAAWKAHDLNNQHNNDNNESTTDPFYPPTTPTMVTYNATLRGIGNLCLAEAANSGGDDERNQVVIDQGLAYGFGVYNHLTHNDHGLPKRNSASIVYLLNVVRACIPPSRTRGNMTVALWHQASREGLVTPELIETIKGLHLHTESNGPEFDVFLASIDECTARKNKNDKVVITPQRFARFAQKYSHSKYY